MDVKTFIKLYRSDWEQLAAIMQSVAKKKSQLTPELVDEFQVLYRKSTNNLSYCKTYFPKEEVTVYLNDLVGRAHHLLYRGQISTSVFQLRKFFGETFIKLLLEQRKFIITAALLFLLGAVGSFITVMINPLHLFSVLPDQISANVDPDRLGEGHQAVDAPAMSAMIMTNNIRVALLAFAGGLTLGIFTVYLMINNGIIIGSLAALFWQSGKFYDFWAYIVPHGMIELTAIFIAGGAGLLMGYKVIVPGEYSRIFQLKQQTLRSVQLFLGTIPLFILAGIIEGYITPAPIPLGAKYIVAGATVVALIVYIWLGHHSRQKNATVQPG